MPCVKRTETGQVLVQNGEGEGIQFVLPGLKQTYHIKPSMIFEKYEKKEEILLLIESNYLPEKCISLVVLSCLWLFIFIIYSDLCVCPQIASSIF